MLLTKRDPKKRYMMLRKGIGVFYNEPDGKLVLKGETSFSKIAGIWINTEKGCYWIKFRNFSEYEKEYGRMI